MTRNSWGPPVITPAVPASTAAPAEVKVAADQQLVKLATQFLASNLFAHHAHLLARGPTFMEDHEHFGDLYAAYDTAYDAVLELFIGDGAEPDLVGVAKDAAANVVKVEGNDAAFQHLLGIEKAMQEQIKICMDGADDGAQGLLQQLAYESKQRVYKISRRVK